MVLKFSLLGDGHQEATVAERFLLSVLSFTSIGKFHSLSGNWLEMFSTTPNIREPSPFPFVHIRRNVSVAKFCTISIVTEITSRSLVKCLFCHWLSVCLNKTGDRD